MNYRKVHDAYTTLIRAQETKVDEPPKGTAVWHTPRVQEAAEILADELDETPPWADTAESDGDHKYEV